MKKITNSAEGDRDEALAWLVGALRWERTLDGLRHGSSVDDDTVATPAAVIATPPARRAEAA